MPHLNRILDFDSLDKIINTTNFYRIAETIIKNANLTNKPSTELCLYFIFSRQGARIDLLHMSLFTEFCLRMLDNRYFEMLKDFIEDFFANKKPSVQETAHVVGLIRRIAQCQKTEYSTKLLEIV